MAKSKFKIGDLIIHAKKGYHVYVKCKNHQYYPLFDTPYSRTMQPYYCHEDDLYFFKLATDKDIIRMLAVESEMMPLNEQLHELQNILDETFKKREALKYKIYEKYPIDLGRPYLS